jgi:hypothetical protein
LSARKSGSTVRKNIEIPAIEVRPLDLKEKM